MKLWRYGHAIEHLGQRYRLEGSLGSGGMADVCLAWDEQEAREVAIKVIKSDQLDQRTLDRFIKEAAQVARWQHPNILRIYSDLKLELLDAAQGSIVPYIVMEYAQGGDLHKRLTPGEPYPFAATLDLFAQLCSAVAYAHEHGVIHRDLKPLNILFRQLPGDCEQVVLSDFGLAVEADASHHTFAQAGTLLYMAPEQFRGHALPASDIFALGVIFYQLCTGRLPFRRNLQELHRLNSAIPTPPSFLVPTLPAALDDIILTALSPDPEQRHPTASALWEAIHAIVYSNHLKPAYNTIPRRSTSPTGPRPALSRSTSPQHAIRPTPVALNPISAQLELAADSQELPPPTSNPASSRSHRFIGQNRPSTIPTSQIDDANIDLSEYDLEISSSNEQSLPTPRTAGHRPSNVYGTGDPLRSPSAHSPSSRASEPSNIYGKGNPSRSPSSPSLRSPGARPPATKNPTATAQPRPPRTIYRIGALTLLLTILCVGALLASLIYFAPSHAVLNMLPNPTLMGRTTVTITPNSQQIAHTYTILAIPNGTPDPNQRQIAARTLSAQQVQTKTINGTGQHQIPATAAKGTVTFTNGTFSSFTIAAGTQLQAANGVTIVTDNSLVIPSADANQNKLGMASISAHAVTSGANGNIPSGSISGTCCAANGVITAHNNDAFTGGQDAKNYTFVQQSDVDAFVNTVKPQLTQQANNALTSQLRSGEQLPQTTTNCPAAVQNDNPIGDQGQNTPSTTVTVTVTCHATAYDQDTLRSLVTNLLQQQAHTDDGPNYAQQGPLTIHAQVQQINQDQSLTLFVTARGLYTYRLNTTRQQQLARLIAGKPTDTARSLLKAQPGIQDAIISTSSATLPGNADQINIETQGESTI